MKKVLLFFVLILCIQSINAQLTDKDKRKLIEKVKSDYSGIDGVQVTKTSSGYEILLITVTVPWSSSKQKQQYEGQKKAYLQATEYLAGVSTSSKSSYQGVSNHQSTYNSTDASEYQGDSYISSNKRQNDNESHSEQFSDCVSQSSSGKVKEIQSLCLVQENSEYSVYAYYLVMSKTSAKKGWAGVMSMVIPGSGQFYKGNIAKGCIFLGGSAALAAGIIVCESTRASYANKAIEQPRYVKEYTTKADNYKTARNVCIGVAGALYLWNVIDAFCAKSARYKRVTKIGEFSCHPSGSYNQVGVTFALTY